jgi:bacillithiol biosynthesis cysteine-adding enzyme BshC
VTVPSRHALNQLQLATHPPTGQPVGSIQFDGSIRELLDHAAEFLGGTPFFDRLQEWYAPGQTMASAFGALIAHVFVPWGLIVIDASGRDAHKLGSGVLRDAILRADELHAALVARDQELQARGYHSQVLVTPESSLLFLLESPTESTTGARLALRRTGNTWKAGSQSYTEAELLAILEETPERISPNALLRSVFQDAILPTTAYVGGPAEIAYFAQSQVLYERLLGRTTPILPRLSATLIEPSIATLLAQHEVALPQVLEDSDDMAQRLGARSMPVEGKRRLAATGNALDAELTRLTAWMASMDESLGQTAKVSASKMRYQMDRLRRLAANFQLQRDASLQRHADALKLSLYPERHPQERRIAGAYFLSRYGEDIAALLVEAADSNCPGHKAIWLS